MKENKQNKDYHCKLLNTKVMKENPVADEDVFINVPFISYIFITEFAV
jgi:hypothetical protein